MCGICELVEVRDLAPTLSPSVYFGPCRRCGKPTMQRALGEPEPDPRTAPVAPPTDGEPRLEGDPSVCPECQETSVHDAGRPFPGKLHQAYLRWRETSDGKTATDAIRARALELRGRGWSHYGIQALAEVVRYSRAIEIGPDDAGFRINNSHLSRLARDLMRESDELVDFFEVRELRSIR